MRAKPHDTQLESIRAQTLIQYYLIYQRQAEDRFGGNMDSFDCVQISIRSKAVTKYFKENKIHHMTNDHHPEEEWWMHHDQQVTQPAGRTRKQSMDRPFGKKD